MRAISIAATGSSMGDGSARVIGFSFAMASRLSEIEIAPPIQQRLRGLRLPSPDVGRVVLIKHSLEVI